MNPNQKKIGRGGGWGLEGWGDGVSEFCFTMNPNSKHFFSWRGGGEGVARVIYVFSQRIQT